MTLNRAFHRIKYSIYKRINRTIFFTELKSNVNDVYWQYSDMVDLLIYNKKEMLNITAIPYISATPRHYKILTETFRIAEENQEVDIENTITNSATNCRK